MSWPFGNLKMFGYDVVMIDPPWRWEAWGGGGDQCRSLNRRGNPEYAAMAERRLRDDAGMFAAIEAAE